MEIIARERWAGESRWQMRYIPSRVHTTHIEVHHSAGSMPTTVRDEVNVIQGIYDHHIQRKRWSDIFYNYIISPEGRIYEGRGESRVSSDDKAAITVMVMGNYETDQPTEKSKQALNYLIDQKFGHLKGAVDWHRARAIRKGRYHSSCPGKNLITWLKDGRKVESTMSEAEVRAALTRGYLQLLGREPDAEGLNFWTDQIVNGEKTLVEVQMFFIGTALTALREDESSIAVDAVVEEIVDRLNGHA